MLRKRSLLKVLAAVLCLVVVLQVFYRTRSQPLNQPLQESRLQSARRLVSNILERSSNVLAGRQPARGDNAPGRQPARGDNALEGELDPEEDCEMCDVSFVFNPDLNSSGILTRQFGLAEKQPLFRHYSKHQAWPEIQLESDFPGQLPSTVHYVWCHAGYLSFQHYLGLLSVVRLLQPIKLIFHYYPALPPVDGDMYNSWLWELRQSLPQLVMRPLANPTRAACGSAEVLRLGLALLQPHGGVLVGSNVLVSKVPSHLEALDTPFWFAFSKDDPTDLTRGMVIAARGFPDSEREALVTKIQATPAACVAPEVYQLPAKSSGGSPSGSPSSSSSSSSPPSSSSSAAEGHCVFVRDSPTLYPVEIMYANTSFAELSRWLYYGKRSPMYPKTVAGQVPRIAHLIWFNRSPTMPNIMQFYQYLTLLSALYVGGFSRVFIHGNKEFSGEWWDNVKGENVTFVRTEDPETVFNQRVDNLAHKSDILRYEILYRYGGVYHDFEAMWTQRAPDWLLSYPAVATSDWVKYGDFPDNINNGVLVARPRAPWIRHMLAAQRYYVDSNFVWNSIEISYKTYERHPDQLFFYRHLQVMCDYGMCHPSWEKNFQRDIKDHKPTLPFDWRKDTLILHVTRPDPERSFQSLNTLKAGRDMYAEVGKNILEKSGRSKLLN